MKRFLSFLFSLLMPGLVLSFAGNAMQTVFNIPIPVTTICLVAGALTYAVATMRRQNTTDPHLFQNGIQKEIWSRYILGAIFKYNAWIGFSFNADEFVMQGKVVHIPQAGSTAAVVKNRSSLPATVTKRTDTDVTYPLDEYTTDPRLIPNADTVELSYDKMDSVMSDDMQALRQTFAENMLIAWAPTNNIIRTTGGTTATAIAAHTPSATGNRLAFHHLDLQAAMTFMNAQDIAQEERYCMMDAQMYDQFITSLTKTQYTDFSRAFDEKTGILGQLYTFKILMRSTVLVFDNTTLPVVKPYGAAGAAADNAGVLCWQKNAVERAMGEIKPFNRDNDPTYYGDLFSFLMRGGGRVRRADEKGIVGIVQKATS